ncbi:hypothetical protein D3C72_1064760 [compost metagenome]
MAGNARRKAEVVLDARAGACLPAGREGVQHDHAQALGRRVDGGGQSGRAGADDADVVDAVLVEFGQQPEAGQHLRGVRAAQHRAVGADHQRKIRFVGFELAQHAGRVLVGVEVEHRVGVVVAAQQRLEFDHGGVAAVADQRRAASALDHRRAAQDQRLHDQFAEHRLRHHQGAQAGRAHDDGPYILHGDAVHQFRHAGELADLGQEVARAVLHDQRAVADAVTLDDAHAPFHHQHQAAGRVAGAHHQFAGTPGPFSAIRRDPGDVGGAQVRIHLPTMKRDDRCGRLLSRRITSGGGSEGGREGVHGG